MASKKNPFPFGNPKVEAKEEKVGKDLDGDKEKGEPLAHKKKVLGPKATPQGKMAPPFMKGKGGKPCPTCKKFPCKC